MKPLLILSAFFCLHSSAQSIKLENLTYGKKESRFVFGGENIFKITTTQPLLNFEYDKSLATITLNNDTLIIAVIQSVRYPERQSNWDGKNNELKVSFITNNGKQEITFHYKKLPYAFPSIATYSERAIVDKDHIIASKKIEIATSAPDTEGVFKNKKILNFELLINDRLFKITGDQLNEEVLSAISTASSGDKITLQQVHTIDNITKIKMNFIGPTHYLLK